MRVVWIPCEEGPPVLLHLHAEVASRSGVVLRVRQRLHTGRGRSGHDGHQPPDGSQVASEVVGWQTSVRLTVSAEETRQVHASRGRGSRRAGFGAVRTRDQTCVSPCNRAGIVSRSDLSRLADVDCILTPMLLTVFSSHLRRLHQRKFAIRANVSLLFAVNLPSSG